MGNLGISVMLHMLTDNTETAKAVTGSIGKIITNVKLEDEKLKIQFSDNSVLVIYDDGQSCCEHRYITCDDDLSSVVGATLVGCEVLYGPVTTGEYDESHETAFLHVKTSLGTIVVCTHNENNGYYGGFALVATLETQLPKE